MKIDNWLKINCKDLTGKKVVIAGATGGIGREMCFLLAKLNADIILACRNIESAENLKLDLKKEYKSINIDILQLDFCDVKSVKKCVSLLKKYKGIDILINNAGVYNIPLKKLDSGFNNIFQINFLYQYYFTKQIIAELEKKENSICIAMGSIAHNYSKINEKDIDFSSQKSSAKIYGNSKRFLMFSLFELFKNSKVNLAIVHPGITLTKMTSHYPKGINWLVKIMIKMIFPTPKKSALSVLYGINHKTNYCEWIGPSMFNVWGFPKLKKLKTCSMQESKNIFRIAENLYDKLKKNN